VKPRQLVGNMPSIRKYKGKTKTAFRARVYIGCDKYLHKTFDKLNDARAWARRVESDVAEGTLAISAKASRHTVSQAIKQYKENILPAITESQDYIKMSHIYLKFWDSRIGDYPFSTITTAIIAKCRDELGTRHKRKCKPATINRYLAHISIIFNHAIKDFGWTTTNPVKDVKRFKEPEGRIRMLSEDELKQLLYAARFERNKPLLLIIVMAIATGGRKAELLNITRDNVHIRKGMIVINKTKGNVTRTLYVSGYCKELLRAHMRKIPKGQKYIFASNVSQKPFAIDREWQRILQRCNITNLHFHDLRHTCASYLAMEGSTTAEIAEVLGHKSLKMVKRYAHLTQKHTADVSGRMQRNIFSKHQSFMPGEK